MLRLAIAGVLCSNEALGHGSRGFDEEYELGDSSGCRDGFVGIDNNWECMAAKDRVDRTTVDHQYLSTYLDGPVVSTLRGERMVGLNQGTQAAKGCGYVEANALKETQRVVPGGSGEYFLPNEAKTFINMDSTVKTLADSDIWLIPPKPYCKRNGSALHQNEVLFHGDVNIDHWVKTSEEFPGSYNIGFPSTCKGLNWRLNNIYEAFEPSMVVTACGESDLNEGASVRKTYRRFKKFVNFAEKHHASLIYMGTKPYPQGNPDDHAKYRKYDLSIKRLVRRRAAEAWVGHGHDLKTFAMVDVHRNFVAAGNPRDLYEHDGLHLSAEGYKMWSTWTHKALDDTTCLVWGSGLCKRRRKMSPLRRATAISPAEIVV